MEPGCRDLLIAAAAVIAGSSGVARAVPDWTLEFFSGAIGSCQSMYSANHN